MYIYIYIYMYSIVVYHYKHMYHYTIHSINYHIISYRIMFRLLVRDAELAEEVRCNHSI